MDRAGKRIEMLLGWRDQAASAGHAVPTVADMMRIGAAGEVRPDGVDLDEVEPWSRTIERLLLQFAFGEPDPVKSLPVDLRSPIPVPAGRSAAASRPRPGPGPGPGDDPTSADGPRTAGTNPVLDALMSWWRIGQANDPGLRRLKEHQLRSIVTTGSRTEAEVRRHLPAPLGTYARRIAEVITRSATPASPAADAPAATPDPGDATAGRPSAPPRPARSTTGPASAPPTPSAPPAPSATCPVRPVRPTRHPPADTETRPEPIVRPGRGAGRTGARRLRLRP